MSYPWTGRINIVKMTILTQGNHRFNATPIFFFSWEVILIYFKTINNNSKILWKHKRLQIAKIILRKNRSTGTMLPNFKLYYKTTVIKTVWCWHTTDTQIKETEKKIEKLTPIYTPTTKEARLYNGEKTTFSINSPGKTGQLHVKESNWVTLSHNIQK